MLGVHPNTVRAWSDAGRLRYYRINPRGDRRYRLGDLQRFLAAAETNPDGLTGIGLPSSMPGRRGAAGAGDRSDGHGLSADRERLRRRSDLATISALARVAGDPETLEEALRQATLVVRERGGFRSVAIHELRGERLVPRAASSQSPGRMPELPRTYGAMGAALARAASVDPGPVAGDGYGGVGDGVGGIREVSIAIPGPDTPWGVLTISADPDGDQTAIDPDLLIELAAATGLIVESAQRVDEVAHRLHRADALRRVAGDIGSRLDLDRILAGLVDHAMVLFNGDRAAVFLRSADGRVTAQVSRGLSARYLGEVSDFPARSLPSHAVAARRPLFATGYRNDPRAVDVRAAVVQEGFDTICTAPLLDEDQILGLLNVYHDAPHDWTTDELETMAALAEQAAVAIKNAQNYEKMAAWAAQLQSIQQLGTRLARLANEREIGLAIATELRQLIDYHNVRVYRLRGEDLIPVAMQGQVGEYVDETPEQLQVKFGEGITGWVAKNRLAQSLPDAGADPRANTIPGTDDDLDESMLLAPMIFEDQVLGVLVLSKLGLHQFADDDLRLLEIYASFAGQAFANADATGLLRAQSDALARQLANQRALLGLTESILATLEPSAILDQVADRLSELVGYDNLSIEILDRMSGLLRPLTAKGVHADEYLEPWLPGEEGLATWVVSRNEPALVRDEGSDERVNQFRTTGVLEGSLICVPLRGREGATGVLTLERLGTEQRYSEEEFELVQLFAAQVSIALQNAEVHAAVEVRAQTDDMTGLLNHGTFQSWLARDAQAHEPFSLIMLDLDDFKRVNDRLGHQAGDRLLAEIGRALVAAGRETDRVFRYGGDEFALILPAADASSALTVAERVRGAVRGIGQPGSIWSDANLSISVSIGVATYPRDGVTADDILLAADRACFVAKRTGQGLIATADEGLAIAADFAFKSPTPIDVAEPSRPNDPPPPDEPPGGGRSRLTPGLDPDAASSPAA